MKKCLIVVLLFVLTCHAGGCAAKSMNYIIAHKPSVIGVVEEVHEDFVVMYSETAEGYPYGSRWQISLNVENSDSYTDLVVGDEIVVYHDGNVMETEPLRVGTVYAITLKTPAARVEKETNWAFAEEDVSVSYANWTEESEIYFGALNREKMMASSVQHLPVYKFDTSAELAQFKHSFGDILAIDYGYDEVPSFNDVTACYDEAFFEENTLILVYVTANSGTYRFGVSNVFCDGNVFCIHVVQTNDPEFVTDDMAGWFITVAVPDGAIENCTQFDADLTLDLK